jgi:hypothetical protein
MGTARPSPSVRAAGSGPGERLINQCRIVKFDRERRQPQGDAVDTREAGLGG